MPPASGLTVTNPAGIAGNPTLVLANDLAALEGLSGTGIAVRSAADTWAQRQVTVSAPLGITNGDGVAGDVAITVSAATTLATGVVQLASDLGTTASTAVQANDSRLETTSDMPIETVHALENSGVTVIFLDRHTETYSEVSELDTDVDTDISLSSVPVPPCPTGYLQVEDVCLTRVVADHLATPEHSEAHDIERTVVMQQAHVEQQQKQTDGIDDRLDMIVKELQRRNDVGEPIPVLDPPPPFPDN